MAIKRVKNKITYVFLALFLLVVTIIGGRGIIPAFADNSCYTSALTDLQKDSSFNANNYLDKFGDYSINVIQIAESVNGELFVYTYQPCQKTTYLVATQVNMSLAESADGTKLYDLELLSSDGVFCKYKVSGLTVKPDNVRYYNITSIFREYDEAIDKGSMPDSLLTGVSYPVGKVYQAKTVNGVVTYSCEDIAVITVTDLFFDYLEYPNGFKFYPSECHGHYVAFSTDMQIDKLCDADVFYNSEYVEENYSYGFKTSTKRGGVVSHTVTLSDVDTAVIGGGFMSKTYSWQRIQSVNDFIESESLKDETKTRLQGKSWVLRYAETEYNVMGDYKVKQKNFTEVTDVTILRLRFKTAGKTYNLGAVSDAGHSDKNPGNEGATPTDDFNFWKWLANLIGVPEWAAKVIFFGVIGLLLFGVLCPILGAVCPSVGVVLKAIVNGILKGLRYLLYGIAWIICLPFRASYRLIKKIRGD